MSVQLHLGDCLAIAPTLGGIDAVVSDPPWGIDADTDYTRFTGQGNAARRSRPYDPISGDGASFDPATWIGYRFIALWGANCFSDRLPMGRWLVWVKKRDSKLGTFMSDAELCWVKKKKTPRRAPGVYVKSHTWDGFDRQSERGKAVHPSQKPVEIMRWTIEMAGIPAGSTILDPYMGSGSTGVAAVQLGFNFVGIEVDPTYHAIASKRIDAELDRHPLLTA